MDIFVEKEDNLMKQVLEVETLSSIYGDQWKIQDEVGRKYSIEISNTFTLYVTLPDKYPSDEPPVYLLSAPMRSLTEKREIAKILNETYLSNLGEPVIFQWVEAIRTYFDSKTEELENVLSSISIESDETSAESDIAKDEYNIEVVHGDLIVDRKSTFQGHVATVLAVDDVKCVLKQLLANKKIANATHNIYAYRIVKGEKCMIQDCVDDGETHAGKRLLQLLQMMDLTNVLVVVSRWYGGIHLGPDRFRHINNAARRVLLSAGYEDRKR